VEREKAGGVQGLPEEEAAHLRAEFTAEVARIEGAGE